MEKDIVIEGVRLHYEVTGNGPALVLMHGWGCDHTTVRSIATTAEHTHTVYNLDLPGFGLSQEPPVVWGVDDYARCVDAFMAHEGIEHPVLVGHSYGGRVAIYLGAEGKIVPEALILIDAAGVKPRRSLSYYYKVYSFKIAKKIALALLGKEKGARIVERMRSGRGSADYASSSPLMKGVMSRSVNQDLRPLMPSVRARQTLLIWGTDDTATPMRDAHIMEKLIPGAALVAFDGCGHYSFLDNPGQFAAVLNSFLNSLISDKKQ